MKNLLLIAMISVLLVGCNMTKKDSGTILGGIAGGAAGSAVGKGNGNVIAIIVGTLAGAAIGGYIGEQMDENDKFKAERALELTPTNQSVSWQNPDSNNQYTVTPTKTVINQEQPCREYVIDAIIGGEPETVYGTACRQADGSWKMSS